MHVIFHNNEDGKKERENAKEKLLKRFDVISRHKTNGLIRTNGTHNNTQYTFITCMRKLYFCEAVAFNYSKRIENRKYALIIICLANICNHFSSFKYQASTASQPASSCWWLLSHFIVNKN